MKRNPWNPEDKSYRFHAILTRAKQEEVALTRQQIANRSEELLDERAVSNIIYQYGVNSRISADWKIDKYRCGRVFFFVLNSVG